MRPHPLAPVALVLSCLIASPAWLRGSDDPCSDPPEAARSGWEQLVAKAAAARVEEASVTMTGAEAFAAYAAAPDRHPQLPNNSFAGYRRGEVPLPDLPVVATVAEFGGVGDGVTDNTEAFRLAIEAAWDRGGGAVLVGPGDWFVDQIVVVNRDGVVLRGSGRDATRLVFRRALKATQGVDQTGSGSSRWSWQGGSVWFSPTPQMRYAPGVTARRSWNVETSYLGGNYGTDWTGWWSGIDAWNGTRLADVVAPASRGDRELVVGDASRLAPGDTVLVTWRNLGIEDGYSLWKHIAGHPLMASFAWSGAGELNKRNFQWPVEVAAVEGNRVRLAQPLRIDVRAGWQVGIETIGPVLRGSGAEDLTVVLEGTPLVTAHNAYDGWNAFFFTKTLDCWVRRVRIVNAENGILSRSNKGLSMIDVLWEGEARLHHGNTVVRGHDTLLDTFRLSAPVHHGISVEDLATGNVSRRGIMDRGTFDSHRFMSFDIVRTDIDLFNDGGPGGAADFGPFVGKNVVHWNISLRQDKGLYVFQPDAHSQGALVGIRGARADTSAAWAMVPGDKDNLLGDTGLVPEPADLHAAQHALRAVQDGWVTWSLPQLDDAPPGDVVLEVGVAVPGGRSMTGVAFRAGGEVVATAAASGATGLVRATWPGAPAGLHALVAEVTDDLGRVHRSAPRRLTVGRRVRVDDTSPRWRFAGGTWSTRTHAGNFGGSTRTTTTPDTTFAEIRFVGTRARLFAGENNTDNEADFFVDDLATPRASRFYTGRNTWRFLVFDTGPLPDGLHTLRIVSRRNLAIDAVELLETGTVAEPVAAPTAAIVAATPLLGEAPLRVRLDASSSAVPAGGATWTWDLGDGRRASGALQDIVYPRPGTYRARVSVRDARGQVDAAETIVRVTSPRRGLPGELVPLVDWGGEMVASSALLRGGNTVTESSLDLDGVGGANDTRHAYPFSVVTPLSPATGYFQQPFHGGIIGEVLGGTGTFADRSIAQELLFADAFMLRFQPPSTTTSRLWVQPLWLKPHFLAGGARHRVVLGPGASFRIGRIDTWETIGQGRWVVRDGETWYLSEATMGPAAPELVVSGADDGRWAPWDPVAQRDFLAATLDYQPRVFADVTAAGFATATTETSNARRMLKFRTFRFTGRLVDEAPTVTVEAWRALHFAPGELGDAAAEATTWGDAADPDRDGLPNLAEAFLGTSPRGADARAGLTVSTAADGLPRLRYARARGRAGVGGVLEWSTDLASWTAEGVVEEVVGETATHHEVEATLPSLSADVFVRWRVTRR